MTGFAHCAGGRTGLFAGKRVAYTHGMVLGEDDLRQEQHYLRCQDHLATRALHGHGTVSGLDVRWNAATGQVEVAPGLAIDPVGRFVCVPETQCADLLRWLDSHRAELPLTGGGGSPPEPTSLYVVLCHRECETDTVPVPSESCRTADESMAASRIQDSFELRIQTAPPREAGEVAGGLLADAAVRVLDLLDSLPGSVADLDAVRAELVAWVTRDRPEITTSACLDAPADNCDGDAAAPSTAVLLARLDLDLDLDPSGQLFPVADPLVVQDARPVLLSTRFLQELLVERLLLPDDHSRLRNLDADDHHHYYALDGRRALTGPMDAGTHPLGNLARSVSGDQAVRTDQVLGADVAGDAAGPAQVVGLRGRPVAPDVPQQGHVLRFEGGSWTPRPAAGDHTTLTGLDADSHQQYYRLDGARPLAGTLRAAGNRLSELSRSAQPEDAVRRDELLGADLGHESAGAAASIQRLQGQPVDARAPSSGDVLQFDGAKWVPARVNQGEAPRGPLLPLVTVTPVGRPEDRDRAVFHLWFHLDAPHNSVWLAPHADGSPPLQYGRGLLVFEEHCQGEQPVDRQIPEDRVEVEQVSCTVFRVDLKEARHPYLRFVFVVPELFTNEGQTLAEYSAERRTSWVGQDRGGKSVTVFVLSPLLDPPLDGFEDVQWQVLAPGGDRFRIPGQ